MKGRISPKAKDATQSACPSLLMRGVPTWVVAVSALVCLCSGETQRLSAADEVSSPLFMVGEDRGNDANDSSLGKIVRPGGHLLILDQPGDLLSQPAGFLRSQAGDALAGVALCLALVLASCGALAWSRARDLSLSLSCASSGDHCRRETIFAPRKMLGGRFSRG